VSAGRVIRIELEQPPTIPEPSLVESRGKTPGRDKRRASRGTAENFTQNLHAGDEPIRIQVGKIAKPKLFTGGREPVGTARCAVRVAERSVRRRSRKTKARGLPRSFRPRCADGRGHRSAMSLPKNKNRPNGSKPFGRLKFSGGIIPART